MLGLAAGLCGEMKESVAVFGGEEGARGLEHGVEGDQLLEGDGAGRRGGRWWLLTEHEDDGERGGGECGQTGPQEPAEPPGAVARARAGEFAAEFAPALLKCGRGAAQFAAEQAVEVGVGGRRG